jgi:citrate lyase beta subunit
MLEVGALTARVDERLADADAALVRDYPGERPSRQPVHTVYVAGDRFYSDLVPRYGNAALRVLDGHEEVFREVTGADDDLVRRVRDKLDREPVEDLRIDFEDGYGLRPDDEEDAHVVAAVSAVRRMRPGPPSVGLRFKSLERPTRSRGIRTLVRFVELLADVGDLPEGFVLTLPKVTSVDQVEAMVLLAESLETGLELSGPLSFELQIETPQSILGPDGTALVARMIHASRGRCTGLHYGTYDYSAFCGIAAGDQSLEHPAADHAKAVMQAAAAGTGVRLSDGSTNVLPVGDNLRAGWELHHRLVTRALHRGFYQGWDLHPAQLPTRYAATFGFYRAGFVDAALRLQAYARQTRPPDPAAGAVVDEPATARALADFVLRGLDCGALTAAEVREATGLAAADLAILAGRPRREGD